MEAKPTITNHATPDTDTAAARSTQALLEADTHLIHPHLPLDNTRRFIMDKGEGCLLWDTNGNEYLDATGGLWLAQIGHGRREIGETLSKQASRLEYFTSFWDFTNSSILKLIPTLLELVPSHITDFVFTSGGSESTEAAIKTARYYWYKKGQPEKNWILSRRNAYHGAAYSGGCASGFEADNFGLGPLVPHFRHLTPPHTYRSWLFDGQDPVDFCIAELEQSIEEIGEDNIAAFIGEPLLGVGGMVTPPEGYWPKLEAVLRRHNILLIQDEVVTGFGRTGSWFACQRYGVQPDIITVAKGITSGYMPMGAAMMRKEIADTVREGVGFPVGYTYSGHPLAATAAAVNLSIIKDEGLVERANTIGDYLAAGLHAAMDDLPVVGEVRHAGMAFGIELVKDKQTREPLEPQVAIADEILDEFHVVVRCTNPTIIVMSPPLILSEAQADRIVEAVSTVVGRFRPDGSYEK
ncbi:aspartate aminotransferase family protein [Bifidobacterium subtile]|jgi:adenosylmethionine-8-amino-7-oxononanoate aminotransferase|uniref:aminotransferase family protein n=1 Tax=Bifidobacterium subtile TaxID=77635 RepID=UPI002F359545